MAKRAGSFAQADRLKKAHTINPARKRKPACFEGEFLGQTKKLRKTIALLEGEKQTLLDEMKTLETKALLGWTHMSRVQICSMLTLGTIVTALVILVPLFFIQPLVSTNLPVSTLFDETGLVSYLREVQAYQNVYLAVHGYDHRCPICGSNGHELACPHGQIPLNEIQRRIEAGQL